MPSLLSVSTSFLSPRAQRLSSLVMPLFASALVLCGAAQAQDTASGAVTQARVIVKFKSAADTAAAASLAERQEARVQGISKRLGTTVRADGGLTERTQVVTAQGISSQQLAAQLSRDSAVEYAVPDELRHRTAAPNDPRYAAGLAAPGPAAGQWYLRAPAGAVRSAINAEGAWTVVAGTTNRVTVAVIDTGIVFDHPDLKRVADGGNLLPGYDFVTNNFMSNDGQSGRDNDPSDPGDWVTAADVANPANTFGCSSAEIGDSSWHGTETAGLIGAITNNARGMASLTGPNQTLQVLPVRALGKCGGFDSDIIAAMRWSAGLSVPGVPANPNPARVINLSLGGAGACTQAYLDAVRDINAAGTVVVASAGNSSGHAVSSPANCTGVIAVAGLRHVGSKVGFSDLGPEIAISAPGGNCVNVVGECVYSLISTVNTGRTTPVAANDAYTTGDDPTVGTSFSSPLVAGTAGLMLAIKPSLTPDDVRSLLRRSSRSFPTSGDSAGVPSCRAPQFDGAGNPIDQDECYCTTSTCGAGMLDAAAAVTLARDDSADDDKGGGGALGFEWLLALGVAIAAMGRARHRA